MTADGTSVTAGALLQISGLTIQYARGRRQPPLTAVQGVSLTIGRGETVALVGESGSGKSTIGNAVLGLVQPMAGAITFGGEDITHAPARRRRALTRHIQAVFQDPYGSLNPVRTIGQTLAEPLRAHQRIDQATAREQISAALERVGLSIDASSRYPAEFSGGQRQRIAIARALMPQPQLIVCDEPTSSLDLSIQAQVLNLLTQLQRDLRLSYLFITHDLAVVRHIAHRVIVLYRGRVMESGPADHVCERPRHPYTQALLAAAPIPDPAEQRRSRGGRRPRPQTTASDPQSGCPFTPRCPYSIEACLQEHPPWQDGEVLVACVRYPEAGKMLPASNDPAASSKPHMQRHGLLAREDHLCR
jgi:peptide/nickel transport system ATP-binding protein